MLISSFTCSILVIPYSREINAAFEQVTPLVAAGFKVLRTMKDISILLAAIQVLTVLSLMMILFVLILLLYSVNPDLEVRRILSVLTRACAMLYYNGALRWHVDHNRTDYLSTSGKRS